MALQDVTMFCCVHAQVCIISVITSIVLFALPLGGCCHACDSGNPEHCVKSEDRAKSHYTECGTSQCWLTAQFWLVMRHHG
jgi:hypothetical protein